MKNENEVLYAQVDILIAKIKEETKKETLQKTRIIVEKVINDFNNMRKQGMIPYGSFTDYIMKEIIKSLGIKEEL